MNIVALLAGLFSGVLGAMGLGGGSVLIIYLTLLTDTKQLTAQGINLLFFIPIALCAVGVYAFKKQIKWATVIPFSLGGVLGAVLGIMLTSAIGGNLTSKIFGGLLIILGAKEILLTLKRYLKNKKKGDIIKTNKCSKR
ncbi:MAG: sulfite exporter TauE/SafE family protein [Clostridia bacterium]|nr:sulfite exporter TauE/SafE family protein [Clostridia bacterium]MBP3705905.1 sulfite exporter TauE/SafE family protein [Clostridia bacterium]